MRRVLRCAGLVGLMLSPASAQGDVVRIGVLSGYDPPPGERSGCPTVGALYVPGLDGGAAAAPPGAPLWTVPQGGGVITSWSFNNAAAGTQVRLAVTRFVKPDAVVVDARSPLETVGVSEEVNTFPTSIPVRGGEQISLDVPVPGAGTPTPRVCYWGRDVSEEFAYVADGRLPTGSEAPMNSTSRGYPQTRVNIAATLETQGGPAADPTTPPPSAAPTDTTAPTVSRLRMRSRLVSGRGASITYTASERATALFLVQHRGRRGWRYLPGGLTHAAQTGSNRFRWDGRLRGRRLAPGRYRMAMALKDAAGNTSRPVHAAFRVAARR